MIQKEAIDRIAELANHNTLAAGLSNVAHRTVALPGDYNLHDLEHLLPHRTRARGRYETTSIQDFCTYPGAAGKGTAVVFVNPEQMTATAIYNLMEDDQPGHCDDLATLGLKKTAAFTALLAVNGARMEQRQIAEWLEDWQSQITAKSAGEEISMSQALSAIRNLTIESVRRRESQENNFSSTQDSFDKIEATSGGRQLPDQFRFSCTPYEGLAERSFALRLSITTGGDKPCYTLRMIALETQEEAMAAEFAEQISQGLSDEQATVRVGKFIAR